MVKRAEEIHLSSPNGKAIRPSRFPKVSVIVTCHNLEDCIGRCLESIAAQNHDVSECETIAIFDYCTDESERIALDVMRAHGMFCRSLKVGFKSLGLSRNAGLEMASGTYVWFVDGDDYLCDGNALDTLSGLLENSDANAVYMKNVESDGFFHDSGAAWRFFYRKGILGSVRFRDLCINEDWDFTKRVAQSKGYREIVTDKVLYHYTFPRKGSVLDRRFGKDKENIAKAFKGIRR